MVLEGINAPGMEPLYIPLVPPFPLKVIENVTVWGWTGPALSEGVDADRWFSEFLGKPLHFVRYNNGSLFKLLYFVIFLWLFIINFNRILLTLCSCIIGIFIICHFEKRLHSSGMTWQHIIENWTSTETIILQIKKILIK